MTAIAATRRTVKELVDGTLRVIIDVEPMNKSAFLALMPDVDTPCFIARDVRHDKRAAGGLIVAEQIPGMRVENEQPIDDPNYWTGPGLSKSLQGLGELIEDPETRETLDKAFKPKGGPHSQDAARICKDAEFQRFVNSRGGFDATENDAAQYMRDYCVIKSRAELDHNLDLGALQRFHRLMRKFNEWRERAA